MSNIRIPGVYFSELRKDGYSSVNYTYTIPIWYINILSINFSLFALQNQCSLSHRKLRESSSIWFLAFSDNCGPPWLLWPVLIPWNCARNWSFPRISSFNKYPFVECFHFCLPWLSFRLCYKQHTMENMWCYTIPISQSKVSFPSQMRKLSHGGD